MKPIFDAWLIQIEVTNACIRRCAHCTRGIRHVRAPYFGDLAYIEQALRSLQGWRKGVGCFGGEPTLHPQFPEICELYRGYFSKQQCGLWTCGGAAYEKHKELIHNTFGIINYNDHQSPCFHHPVMIASEEVVKDEQLRNEMVDHCWLQLNWSPIITPKGGFFCEVAATFDLLFGESGGYPLEPGWWEKDVEAFQDQRQRYCRYCSIAIPMQALPDDLEVDYASPGNAHRLMAAGSPQAENKRLKIVDSFITLGDIQPLASQKRPPKQYAKPDPKHFWVKTPLAAWFWKRAKCKHIPHGNFSF